MTVVIWQLASYHLINSAHSDPPPVLDLVAGMVAHGFSLCHPLDDLCRQAGTLPKCYFAPYGAAVLCYEQRPAAPVRHQGDIIGVVTLAKPSVTVQPFVEWARRNIEEQGTLLLLGAIALCILITLRGDEVKLVNGDKGVAAVLRLPPL